MQLNKKMVTLQVGKKVNLKLKNAPKKKKAKLINGKNADEVAALQKIITEQNAKGATIPTDINQLCVNSKTPKDFVNGYRWNKDGRLEEILWYDCDIKGAINLGKLPALKSFNCGSNEIISLDISKNIALIHLYCYGNELTNLNVSKNVALDSMNCGLNKLTSLDVSKNTALTDFNYDDESVKVIGLPR